MANINSTLLKNTEFAGVQKLVTVTATITSSSDYITFTDSTHGISAIDAIVGVNITGGLDAAFSYLQASYSGANLTIASFEQDGTVATDFTGTTVSATVLGH